MSCPDAQRRARSLHVYNDRFALTAEPLHPDAHASTYRLNLEVAAARSDGGSGFNWAVGAKISVHLAPREMSDLFAVLNGWRERAESTHRGASRNKGYRVFVDGGHVIVQLFVPQGRRTVKLEPYDRFAVSSLVLELVTAEARGPGIDTVFQQLRAAYEQPQPLVAPRRTEPAVAAIAK